MAQKRMFDKDIISQESFIELPMESKALYFLLGMEADDEGFVNHKKVLRNYGGSEDGIKILVAKNFIIPFKNGVVVITDWNTNNWLDRRRIKPTIYTKEKECLEVNKINHKYILAKPALSSGLESIEEYRVEEYRVEENNNNNIFNIIERNFNRTISPSEINFIQDWLLSFSEEIIMYAVDKACLQNKKTFSYVNGILNNWKSCGYKTLQEIANNERDSKKDTEKKESFKETLEKRYESHDS